MKRSAVAILLLAILCPACAWAQSEASYPARALRWIVPFPAGGSTDSVARLVARDLAKTLGQSVLVDNRPGAGGLLGMEAVLNLPADGHTLAYATISTLAVLPLAHAKPSYDPLRDFVTVTQLATLPYVISAHPSVPAKSVADFVKLARAKPGTINYGSTGYGTGTHLTAEYFSSTTGIKLVHVPYKGDAPGLLDLMSGQIAIAVFPPVAVLPHLKSGRLRGLAVTSLERTSALPDVQTVAEAGYSGFEAASWHGVALRSSSPAAIVRRLHKDISTIVLRPGEVRSTIESTGSKAVGNTPEEFEAYVRSEIRKWKAVISDAAIRID